MSTFFNPYSHQFLRIATCVPTTAVADPSFNLQQTLALLHDGHRQHIGLMLFPELGISSYAIDDLLQQDALLEAVEAAVGRLVSESEQLSPVFVVGAPLRVEGKLFNAAVVIHSGRILGIVPKAYLPNYREFYERRHFVPGIDTKGQEAVLAQQRVPFGVDLLFRSSGTCPFTFHVEICEDIWVPQPPSTAAAMAGAEVLLNLSASNITIGKAEDRRLLCNSQSMRCIAAYVYSAAGPGESTTDLAWDGHAGIFENGVRLAETERFAATSTMAVADVDLGRLRQERLRRGTFHDCASAWRNAGPQFRHVPFTLNAPEGSLSLLRNVERFPYVPTETAALADNCYEAYNIQVQGLAKRLQATGTKKVVIGVSGGLDSTQALLVSVRAMDLLGHPRSNVLAYTMPGFATGETSKSNAWALMRSLQVSAAELDIRPAARQMLTDLNHPYARGEPIHDVTFENVQAGLRTDYLFRLANQNGGLVVGTGDLSELALGWCTYGVGDQMSHYNVNSSVPKTLIQHLIRFVAGAATTEPSTAKILDAVLGSEITPELVPPDSAGKVQSTEATIGPYALQDFNLFYVTRYGFRPSKVAFLAWSAWHDVDQGHWPPDLPGGAKRAYTLAEIKHWLGVFAYRFFAISQFKRTAMPNGAKISSGGSLSPRGDWRAPADSSAQVWLAELESAIPDTD